MNKDGLFFVLSLLEITCLKKYLIKKYQNHCLPMVKYVLFQNLHKMPMLLNLL